jgi:hypothetical protein
MESSTSRLSVLDAEIAAIEYETIEVVDQTEAFDRLLAALAYIHDVPPDDLLAELAAIEHERIAEADAAFDASPDDEWDKFENDVEQMSDEEMLKAQRKMDLELLAEARRRLRAEQAARVALTAVSAGATVAAQPRASAAARPREHTGRRAVRGARSPDDPDPEAARREGNRRRQAESRERRRQKCSKCSIREPNLHDGLCWKHWLEAEADRKATARGRARLAEAAGEFLALRDRAQTQARVRQDAWLDLPSANGNRERLRANVVETTRELARVWRELRLAKARDPHDDLGIPRDDRRAGPRDGGGGMVFAFELEKAAASVDASYGSKVYRANGTLRDSWVSGPVLGQQS